MLYHYYIIAGLCFRSDVRLPSLEEVEELPHSIEIQFSLVQKIPEGELVENLSRLGINPDFAFTDLGVQLDWKEHGLFQIEEGNRIRYDIRAIQSEHFEHFLINEVLAAVFFQRNYFLLHGSAALLPNGNAVAFFGEPGAGKSTTLGAFVNNGCTVLTDEIVAISFDQMDTPVVWPFIPILRLWSSAANNLGYIKDTQVKKYEFKAKLDFLQKDYPLQAVFSLIKSDVEQLTVEKSSGQQAHLDLIGNFPLPKMVLDPLSSLQRFKQAAKILSAADSYVIYRNENSFDTIKNFAEQYCESLKPETL